MYQTIKPPIHLGKYIDCFWLGDDESISDKPNSHHLIANSKIELLFFCDGIYSNKDKSGNLQKTFKAGFYGQTTDFDFYFSTAKKTRIFGIRFLPVASLTLFKLPASELTSERIDITCILGNRGTELAEKIYGAHTFEQKSRIAIEFFSNRVKELHLKYQSVEKVILKIEQANISLLPQMISQSYLSQRQFERHFKELTGFSARTYLKLKRFEQFVETASTLKSAAEDKLIDIALEVGYYDQAHLNRHFKEFTGTSPTAYFRNSATQ
jgi:AraC-like DNA-binding protein